MECHKVCELLFTCSYKVGAEPEGDETVIVFHSIFLKFKYLWQESLCRKIDIDTFSSGYASSLSPCLKQ